MARKQQPKIKYTAFVATSIDGRIAKNSGSGSDWTSKEDWKYFQASLAKTDVVIVGHNTYKVAKERLKRRNTIVITSKVLKIKLAGSVVFLNPKKDNLKNFLRNSSYKKVAIIGGPRVYSFCLENKMLDEIFITIEPYLFTAGVPMFAGSHFKKYSLRLLSIKKLNNKGTLLLQYSYGG